MSQTRHPSRPRAREGTPGRPVRVMASSRTAARVRPAAGVGLFLVMACLAAACSTPSQPAAPVSSPATSVPATATTDWMCRPGMADDPCVVSLATTRVSASGSAVVARPAIAPTAGRFDCFYVHPRIGPIGPDPGSGLSPEAESAQAAAATEQAARFSQVCRVWAPYYDEGQSPGPAGGGTAEVSVQAAFEDYLAHDNDGRPIIFIGHSEGAATLTRVLSALVDTDPGLRSRMVLAILLGGNVEAPAGKVTGGTFSNIPLCTAPGEAGCVIAYSSFPGTPPADSMFGRPGQGISLTSGQPDSASMEVACVNPAAIGGGGAGLDPVFSTEASIGVSAVNPVQQAAVTTPWVAYPGLFKATCEHGDGASWLQVTQATGPSGHQPVITEQPSAAYGYHVFDVNLALGDLVTDVAAAESTWSRRTR
jgi:hypothetical protein